MTTRRTSTSASSSMAAATMDTTTTTTTTTTPTPPPRLPAAGEIKIEDYRTPQSRALDARRRSTLRVVQFNVERGYQLERIIEQLEPLDADVVCLQEVDIGCRRSGGVDVGAAIARRLRLLYAFACEFEELDSLLRKAADAGGGVHGQALLSRYDFVTPPFCTPHRAPPAIDWATFGHAPSIGEPRRGARIVFGGVVDTPSCGPVLCYSMHLEVFCGVLERVRQFADVFDDARSRHRSAPRALVCGDLNTMAHRIARLSPKYCRDRLRVLSLGKTESEWWRENVLAVVSTGGDDAHHRDDGARGTVVNERLRSWGVDEQTARAAVNPGGFVETFDECTTTLENHGGLYTGKLDWMLARQLRVVARRVGNDDYSASDHKWLCADYAPCSAAEWHRDVLARALEHSARVNRPLWLCVEWGALAVFGVVAAAVLACLARCWRSA